MADKLKGKTTPVRAYPHASDSRANIPTAELESFARPEEKSVAIVRYPRDPTLDTQLVWKGKDEQDAHDLEVPAVPIYIQETIDPLALVEELRVQPIGGIPVGYSCAPVATPPGGCHGQNCRSEGTGACPDRKLDTDWRRGSCRMHSVDADITGGN